MIKVIYNDGNTESINEANAWDTENSPDGFVLLVKRKFDAEESYDESEDKDIALFDLSKIRGIVVNN